MYSDEVACQGLFNRKFEILYEDGTAGATTATKLWVDSRKTGEAYTTPDGEQVYTMCDCCTTYSAWKTTHRTAAHALQQIADIPCYYQVCDEQVKVHTQVYLGTIRALHLAPKGACKGIASHLGPHPYTCEACEALQHGKNSQLLHKLMRASKLKHPRSEQKRATQSGVTHKYCTKSDIESALHSQKVLADSQSKHLARLSQANEKLLRDSWKSNATARPFVEQLLQLFATNRMSEFDLKFLHNWLGKKVKGQYFHASEQARSLAILLSNRLGEKMYSTVAPMMGLPLARQAQRLRAKERHPFTYMPGLNDWAFAVAAENRRPFQNSMDGTRVVRTIELYQDEYLVGESFPPDVRQFPHQDQLPKAESWEQVQKYVLEVRAQSRYAAEAYSFDLVDTTGKLPDLLTGSIPEAISGVTASHIYALMLEVEHKASMHKLSLIGHCTDSASNALNALLKLATPSQYLTEQGISFLGLQRQDYFLFAPFFRQGFPSVAYACWDHSSRTVLRNLMSLTHSIVAEIKTSAARGKPTTLVQKTTASVQDLCHLKKIHPASIIKHGDITPYIRQNCDATSRVLTQTTIDELKAHVPGSQGTQLYLQAAVWTHVPYRNDKFGSPPAIGRSLWAGIMTWRRWRQYILVTPTLSLTTNFVSRAHYLTEEVLVHAGINHLLCMYICFPSCNLSEYSLRHTGNRGIEAIHGMFRGGTNSLPITSPNLSFREFLAKMNAAQQIKRAEHSLSKSEGSTIVASKKKRKTFAARSGEASKESETNYTLPATYKAFLEELEEACQQGDMDSMRAIEHLAPQMASTLKAEKEGKQWKTPDIPLDDVPPEINIITSLSQLKPPEDGFLKATITRELGQLTSIEQATQRISIPEDAANQALANFLVDIAVIPSTESNDLSDTLSHIPPKGNVSNSQGETARLTCLLKGLQPQREVPSKDRGKRFAAGDLAGNKPLHIPGNEVQELQFWTVFPTSQALRNAKVFLLGQISLILSEGKPCQNAEKNPSTEVVLTIYSYNPSTNSYRVNGRTALLKAPSVLQTNVTEQVHCENEALTLAIDDLGALQGYVPFTNDINIESRLATSTPTEVPNPPPEDEEYVVENIVKKQFNTRLGQYEFLVKWRGYSAKHNTWELITNIPDAAVNKFEQDRRTPAVIHAPARSGLRNRQTIKQKLHPDFISNT